MVQVHVPPADWHDRPISAEASTDARLCLMLSHVWHQIQRQEEEDLAANDPTISGLVAIDGGL
jgi:hypothetical protein